MYIFVVSHRFLACNKKGIKFTPKEVNLYSESWDCLAKLPANFSSE